jgi:hypothetical protein
VSGITHVVALVVWLCLASTTAGQFTSCVHARRYYLPFARISRVRHTLLHRKSIQDPHQKPLKAQAVTPVRRRAISAPQLASDLIPRMDLVTFADPCRMNTQPHQTCAPSWTPEARSTSPCACHLLGLHQRQELGNRRLAPVLSHRDLSSCRMA